jgi:hypothetical protein
MLFHLYVRTGQGKSDTRHKKTMLLNVMVQLIYFIFSLELFVNLDFQKCSCVVAIALSYD